MYFNFCFCFITWYSYRNSGYCNMIKICAIAAGIENYKSIVGKTEKKYYETVLLARSKLNRTVVLNYKTLVD